MYGKSCSWLTWIQDLWWVESRHVLGGLSWGVPIHILSAFMSYSCQLDNTTHYMPTISGPKRTFNVRSSLAGLKDTSHTLFFFWCAREWAWSANNVIAVKSIYTGQTEVLSSAPSSSLIQPILYCSNCGKHLNALRSPTEPQLVEYTKPGTHLWVVESGERGIIAPRMDMYVWCLTFTIWVDDILVVLYSDL